MYVGITYAATPHDQPRDCAVTLVAAPSASVAAVIQLVLKSSKFAKSVAKSSTSGSSPGASRY